MISTAYEYDINGNAPQFILNPIADLNSLTAYFSRRLTQAELPMPVDADGTIHGPDGAALPAGSCTVTCRFEDYPDGNGGTVTVRVTRVGGVTYVGYETEHLPLVQPLIDFGGEPGAKIAGVIESGGEARPFLRQHTLEAEHQRVTDPPLIGGLTCAGLDLGERVVERTSPRRSRRKRNRRILIRVEERLPGPGFRLKGGGG